MIRRALAIVAALLVLLAVLAIHALPAASDVPVVSGVVPAEQFSPLTPAATPLQRRDTPAAVSSRILTTATPALVPATASGDVRPVGAPSPDVTAVSDRVLALANEAPNPSPMRRVTFPPATATPSPASLSGVASWWASFGPGIYAALPGYVAGTRVRIRVWSGELYVDTPVITSCGCFVGTPQERIVDLSPGILRALGLDPSRGLYPVAIERLP